MARLNPSNLPFAFRDYADQLDYIHTSLSAMAKGAGDYKAIVARMAMNVHSASNVLRAASHVINSMESHKEHEANKIERDQAKARRAGR